MVGTIGALRAAQVGPVDKAVDYAFTLVAGWQKKDRAEIEGVLTELKAAAAHNAKIYKQASQALNDLSRREKEATELEAKARRAMEKAEIVSRETNESIQATWAELEARRAKFEVMVKTAGEKLTAREESGLARETAVKQAGTKSTKLQLEAKGNMARAKKLMAEAVAMKAAYEGRTARLKAIIAGG